MDDIKSAFARVLADSQPMAPEEAEYQRAFGPKPPVSDPSETLALIAEHNISVVPRNVHGWLAAACGLAVANEEGGIDWAGGDTIADAVRACVARIREGK